LVLDEEMINLSENNSPSLMELEENSVSSSMDENIEKSSKNVIIIYLKFINFL
jgi:hypothetical protein